MGHYIPRLEVAFGYYHLGTRGNNHRPIYDDDFDRNVFLVILNRIARKYGWKFYAWCLMGNHYHLVVQIGEGGLSRAMCELYTAHAVNYNVRHNDKNHLFGKRFWGELITTDEYLLASCRYALQNPVRAGLCASCSDWKWSSYGATVGTEPPNPHLAVAELFEIHSPNARDPIARFREFCATPVLRRPLKPACTPAPSRPPAGSGARPSR